VAPSVRLSYAGICDKTAEHIRKLLSPPCSDTILVFPTKRYGKEGMKKFRFSTNISLYLGNVTRYNHICDGMRIKNRTQAFEWYHFQWPWTIPNPDFKATPLFFLFFNAKYVESGRRYRQSYNEILIRTHTRPTQVCNFQWCPRGQALASGRLGTYGLGLRLEGPDLGLENCTDNFLASPSNLNKLIIVIIIN